MLQIIHHSRIQLWLDLSPADDNLQGYYRQWNYGHTTMDRDLIGSHILMQKLLYAEAIIDRKLYNYDEVYSSH